MSEGAIERLDSAEKALRHAIEGADPKTIEEALASFAAALEPVRGLGAWHADPALKERLIDLRQRMQSDQTLSRLLADMAQLKLDGIGDATARNTYSRKG
jgi:hypothetical protein